MGALHVSVWDLCDDLLRFFKTRMNVPEKSESWSYRICEVWSTKFTHMVFFPLVHLSDASRALMPNTTYLHFSKCHKHNFIIGSEKLAELLPFPPTPSDVAQISWAYCVICSKFSKVFEVQFVIASMVQMRNTILLHYPYFLSFYYCGYNGEKTPNDEVKCGTH